MLKTGITTATYFDKEIGGTNYKKMASHGYSCADFSGIAHPDSKLYQMSDDELKEHLAEVKKTAAAAGITFSQVHGTWPVLDTSPELIAGNLEKQKACVRATAFLDCKNLVVHPLMPYEWGNELDPDYAEKINDEFFKELCEYAQGYNVNICIENMPTKKHRLAGIENLVKFVKKFNMPNFRICLDTGHCHVRDEDSGDMVRACDGLLEVLHVHDNNGRTDAHTIPYGGNLNWNSFKKALAETGFNGALSLESSISCHASPELKEKLLVLSADIAKELADI